MLSAVFRCGNLATTRLPAVARPRDGIPCSGLRQPLRTVVVVATPPSSGSTGATSRPLGSRIRKRRSARFIEIIPTLADARGRAYQPASAARHPLDVNSEASSSPASAQNESSGRSSAIGRALTNCNRCNRSARACTACSTSWRRRSSTWRRNGAPKFFTNYIGSSPAATQVKQQARRAARWTRRCCCSARPAPARNSWRTRSTPHRRAPTIPSSASTSRPSRTPCSRPGCFGAAPGAYTGADKRRAIGKFSRLANGGLFLDEIGDMPLAMQAKLLRDCCQGTGGSSRSAATKGGQDRRARHRRDLARSQADVAAGRFRADLYYRLRKRPHHPVAGAARRTEDFGPLCDHIPRTDRRPHAADARELDRRRWLLQKRCRCGNIREAAWRPRAGLHARRRPHLQRNDITASSSRCRPLPATARRNCPGTYEGRWPPSRRRLIARCSNAAAASPNRPPARHRTPRSEDGGMNIHLATETPHRHPQRWTPCGINASRFSTFVIFPKRASPRGDPGLAKNTFSLTINKLAITILL